MIFLLDPKIPEEPGTFISYNYDTTIVVLSRVEAEQLIEDLGRRLDLMSGKGGKVLYGCDYLDSLDHSKRISFRVLDEGDFGRAIEVGSKVLGKPNV